jgi:asparagine synthase (glutamine-hydrolysing)
MLSASRRYVLNFNGEVYNFRDIRRVLDAEQAGSIPWRGHSDSEVLVEAIAAWGVEKAIARCEGMFALAVWDRIERTLWLVRDRIGEKPLYYGAIGGTFAFASEIGALYAAFGAKLSVDHAVLPTYLRGGHIPAPRSIYREIQKLRPAHLVCVPFGKRSSAVPVQVRYWSLRHVLPTKHRSPSEEDRPAAAARVENVLLDAVSERMVGDVPVGAFLSGGVDSSLVVGMMAQRSSSPVQAFTIAFEDSRYDESRYARLVAEQLANVVHTQVTVTAEDYLALIPKLVATFGEPFADASQIPTFLLARLARGTVKVALSGEGADELFGGYDKYIDAKRIWRVLSRIPVPVRRIAAQLLTMPSVDTWDRLLKYSPSEAHELRRINGDRIHKLASTLSVADRQQFYAVVSGSWRPVRDVVRDDDEAVAAPNDADLDGLDFAEEMMAIDLLSSLPDGILTKIDRATMAVGLESRAPFLAERVVAEAWSLPVASKLGGDAGKLVLREMLPKYLGREVAATICQRQKMGFSTPLASWLRGALRPWAEHLLQPSRLRGNGLQAAAVRQKWREHLSGSRNWQYALWPVLMWQAYFDDAPSAREVA